MNGCLQETEKPECRIKVKTTLIQKDSPKEPLKTIIDP